MLDTVGVTLVYFYSGHTHTGTYVSLCLGIFCRQVQLGPRRWLPSPDAQAQAPCGCPFIPSPQGPEHISKKKDETSGSVSDGVPPTRQSQLILLVLTGAHLLDSPELAGTRPSDPIIQAT